MKQDEAVKIIINYLNTMFPKKCPLCNQKYDSLSDYLKNTTMVGKPISYDAEDQDWHPNTQIGTVCFANCSCGTTMSLDSLGIERRTLWRLLRWTRDESKEQGISISHFLHHICQKLLHDI